MKVSKMQSEAIAWIRGFADGVTSRYYSDRELVCQHFVSLLQHGSLAFGEGSARESRYCRGYIQGEHTHAYRLG